MIEIHDDWYYLTLWYAYSAQADYTVLVFRRAAWTGDHRFASCEAIARFRSFASEEERKTGLVDGAEGWFAVPAPVGAGPEYVLPLAETLVKNISVHPEFGVSVTIHQHNINSGGAALREVIASAPWVS